MQLFFKNAKKDEIVDRSRNFQDKKILITDSESAQKEGLGGAQLHMTHGILP